MVLHPCPLKRQKRVMSVYRHSTGDGLVDVSSVSKHGTVSQIIRYV